LFLRIRSADQSDCRGRLKTLMRWTRRIPPILVGLIFMLMVISPVLGLLALTRQQRIERAQGQIRLVSEATIKHSDRVLGRVKSKLEQLIAEGATSCSPEHRARMTQAVYETIEIRGFGVLDRKTSLFYCTESTVYDPPLPVEYPEHLRIGKPGTVALVAPQDDVRKQQSIFVNYGLPDGRILDAAIYPEQFWSFQEFLGLGDGGGVYLANDDGRLLSGVNNQSFKDDMLHTHFAKDYYNLGDRAWVSVRASNSFPVTAVTFIGEETVLGQWRSNLRWFGSGGVILGLVSGLIGWRLAKRPLSVVSELRIALRDQETTVHYQPILDLETRKVIGAEALFRWPHKSLNAMPVTDVIAVATREGLLTAVTMAVMRRVQIDLEPLLQQDPNFKVSVNIGVEDLKAGSDLDRFLHANAAIARAIQIEMTERELMPKELADAQALLRSWRALGVRIALDDFGTGYSNLAYLQQFAVDVIKVDRMFVAAADHEPGAGILDAVVTLATKLELEVIAEGIEEAQQLSQMQSRGIRFGQGWLFAKAEPIEDLLVRLQKSQA
jgi:sensor c-di-GMP phosphodiesterase-like protein